MMMWVWLTDGAGQDVRVSADKVTHLVFAKDTAPFFADGKRHDFRLSVYTAGTKHVELAFDDTETRDIMARKITGEAW